MSYAVNKFNVDFIIGANCLMLCLVDINTCSYSLLNLQSVTKSLRQNQLMGQK